MRMSSRTISKKIRKMVQTRSPSSEGPTINGIGWVAYTRKGTGIIDLVLMDGQEPLIHIEHKDGRYMFQVEDTAVKEIEVEEIFLHNIAKNFARDKEA